MDTSLQGANFTADTLPATPQQESAVGITEAEHHIHMPSPSLWPLILGIAILVTITGLLFIPDDPWLSIVAAPFVLVGIIGWGLEDSMGGHHEETEGVKEDPRLTPDEVLQMARDTLKQVVTISSTVWSAHPVTVELDEVQGNNVVLALYGKVELEAQRERIEDAMWQLPNVANVKNFIVAEDAILNIAYERIENMRAKGKLEGARNISVLVENYILNLYGDVPNQEMKLALERELIGIPGVNVIVNHIGLDENIPGYLGKTRNR